MARSRIDDILARESIPLLVGGSMLYLSSVTDGLTLGPAPDPVLRERLMAEFLEDGGTKLFERLKAIDPATAATIDRKNVRRLIRAMEICERSGAKKSVVVPAKELRSGEGDSGFDTMILGVALPREELMARIDARTKAMVEGGWIEEVRSLMGRGYSEAAPGMKAVGYTQIMRLLRTGDCDASELAEVIAKKTRNYAKRQISWWRGDERIRWIYDVRT